MAGCNLYSAAVLLALYVSCASARNILVTDQPADPATKATNLALATGGELPLVPPSACSDKKSPQDVVNSGTNFKATLSGLKNVKPNTTGVLMPVPGKASGTYLLVVDEKGQKASWTLELCDVPEYTASHLHTGSKIADFPPPLIPLEPYVIPPDPFAPPNLLPQLCPPVNITGCSYTARGSFTNQDMTSLLGRQPQGDYEVPTVTNWSQFLKALKDGKIYVNVHSKLMPAGLIRGNLEAASSGNAAASG